MLREQSELLTAKITKMRVEEQKLRDSVQLLSKKHDEEASPFAGTLAKKSSLKPVKEP